MLVSAFDPFAASASVRTANHSVTTTVSSSSSASPSLVIAMARGWARAGRESTVPRWPVAAMVSLRSIVFVTDMSAASIFETVPSTQFVT